MTYRNIVTRLSRAGIDEADSEAGILLSHFCGVPPHELVWRKDENFDSSELAEAVLRREKREPLQYIIGKWSFMGLGFSLNSGCLCPRADTECIAEAAIKRLPRGSSFTDIGTGSGAIAVSVLYYRPDLTAVAADISSDALRAAADNAEANGVGDRIKFLQADALSPSFFSDIGRTDAVVSNPPYIPTGDIPGLAPELAYEPHAALDGGADGMLFYNRITEGCAAADIPLIIYEAGAGQADDIAGYAEKYSYSASFEADLGGIKRAVILERNRKII